MTEFKEMIIGFTENRVINWCLFVFFAMCSVLIMVDVLHVYNKLLPYDNLIEKLQLVDVARIGLILPIVVYLGGCGVVNEYNKEANFS